MIKELQYKGYATEPSDYECPDGQLATSLNLINEDEQLKPVFQPQQLCVLPSGHRVACVHNTSQTDKLYILTYGSVLKYFNSTVITSAQQLPVPLATMNSSISDIHNFLTASIYDIGIVGNTLVVLASDGVHYVLWNGSQYKYIGQKPPEIKVTFGLRSEFTCYPKDKNAGSAGATVHEDCAHLKMFIDGDDVVMPFVDTMGAWVKPKDDWSPPYDFQNAFDYSLEGIDAASAYVKRWTDFAMANVNMLISQQGTKEGKFVFPFLVRWAYELYDGSLIMHSDPVLLIPNSKYPFFAMRGDQGFDLEDVGNDNRNIQFFGRAYGFVAALTAKIINSDALSDLNSNWSDIVQRINIYVSAPVYTYKQDGKVFGWTNMDDQGDWDEFYTEGEVTLNNTTACKQFALADVFHRWNVASGAQAADRYFVPYDGSHPLPSYILTMPERTEDEILKDVETGTFYKIKSYGINDYDLNRMASNHTNVKLEDGTLGSLYSREVMKDDYHSRDKITAKRIFVYNNRANMADIRRTLHSPLSPVIAWARNERVNNTPWVTAVEISTDATNNILVSDSGNVGCTMPRFVFYPDKYAKFAYLKLTDTNNNNTVHEYKVALKEHPFLEGAYWFGSLHATLSVSETSGSFPEQSATDILQPNKIYTSEPDNPFVFPALGINTVGTGTIIAIAAAAKALSQGQFGEFPLYAFTTEGVWALEVSPKTGAYSARQPITRDVCISPDSITQLDDTVLFATKRGIMLISGSQTQCITDGIFSEAPFNVFDLPGIDQLHAKIGHSADACLPTKPFLGFLAGCQMVYDYVHQRIFVFNPATETVNGVTAPLYTYAYVFSLKSKMWGMTFSSLKSTINSYPDALAMTHDNKLVSFSETDETVCKGLYITRPLKLEAADVHKTISALIQRGHFQRGDVGTVLYGSRDLYTWHLIWSSKDQYLRGFRGTPYKYFRIAGVATLTDGKSIFGASINFEPRHTNQLR